MAMCASGSLGILSAPQGGCSSISIAVNGNATPPKSLTTLSVSAGKTAPHCMTEFYNYSNVIPITVANVSTTSLSTCCLRLDYLTPVPNTGECYDISINWCLGKSTGIGTSACVKVFCCGLIKYACNVTSSGTAYNCQGSFNSFNVNSTTAVCFCVAARTSTPDSQLAVACISMASIGNVVGSYSIGTPSTSVATNGTI